MCTDQEALRTKRERKHSYDGIGKVRLYALLRKQCEAIQVRKEKMYRLSGTREHQRSKRYKGSRTKEKP